MLSRIRLPEISQRMQFLIYITSFAFLMQWVPGTLADTSIYFGGGEKLIQQKNPYDGSSPFFSAPTGAKFLFLVGDLLRVEQFPIMWNIVNILGVSIFFYVVLKTTAFEKYAVLIMAIFLMSAPVREMVVNNQVTGLVLGLTSMSIFLAQKTGSRFLLLFLFLPIYLSFELKPNLILGFLIYYFWIYKRVANYLPWLMMIALLAMNMLLFRFQYLNWIEHLSTQGLQNITGFESLGLSTLAFESNILNYDNARFFGVALFASSLVFLFSTISIGRGVQIFTSTPIVALSFPYLHLLDLIIALPFIVPRVFQESRIRFLSPLVIVIIFLPRPSDSLLKYLAIILLILLVSVFQFITGTKLYEATLSAFAGLSVTASNYALPLQNLSDHEIQNFTVLRVWLIVFIILFTININGFRENLEKKGVENRVETNI